VVIKRVVTVVGLIGITKFFQSSLLYFSVLLLGLLFPHCPSKGLKYFSKARVSHLGQETKNSNSQAMDTLILEPCEPSGPQIFSVLYGEKAVGLGAKLSVYPCLLHVKIRAKVLLPIKTEFITDWKKKRITTLN
jgi:hypothetical protein